MSPGSCRDGSARLPDRIPRTVDPATSPSGGRRHRRVRDWKCVADRACRARYHPRDCRTVAAGPRRPSSRATPPGATRTGVNNAAEMTGPARRGRSPRRRSTGPRRKSSTQAVDLAERRSARAPRPAGRATTTAPPCRAATRLDCADVGDQVLRGEQLVALGVRLHEAVLDAVVHHLRGSGPRRSRPRGRSPPREDPGAQRVEDRHDARPGPRRRRP